MRMIMVSDEVDGQSIFVNPMQIEAVFKDGIKAKIYMSSGKVIHTSNLFSSIIKLIEQELTKPQGE